ncbi:MAG: FecR domain-containing protein, partial [Burkholderiales bacterium]|nr:FecR domain-containing protein [Burkholderiales bacterium]
MAGKRKHLVTSLGVLLAGTTALSSGAQAQSPSQVGTTAAVKPSTTGTRPTGQIRILQIGADLVFKERVQTAVDGAAQVLFIDKSTLNLGPDSDVLIDEYVYNPNAGTGRMVANIAKGALRFVGGNISHTEGITIKTPSGAVGVRGGVVFVSVTRTAVKSEVNVLPVYGVVTFTRGNQRTELQVGQRLTVSSTPGPGTGGSGRGASAQVTVVPATNADFTNAQQVVQPPPGMGPGPLTVPPGAPIGQIGATLQQPQTQQSGLPAISPLILFPQTTTDSFVNSGNNAAGPPPSPPTI